MQLVSSAATMKSDSHWLRVYNCKPCSVVLNRISVIESTPMKRNQIENIDEPRSDVWPMEFTSLPLQFNSDPVNPAEPMQEEPMDLSATPVSNNRKINCSKYVHYLILTFWKSFATCANLLTAICWRELIPPEADRLSSKDPAPNPQPRKTNNCTNSNKNSRNHRFQKNTYYDEVTAKSMQYYKTM